MVWQLVFLSVHHVFPEFYSSTVPNESEGEVEGNRVLRKQRRDMAEQGVVIPMGFPFVIFRVSILETGTYVLSFIPYAADPTMLTACTSPQTPPTPTAPSTAPQAEAPSSSTQEAVTLHVGWLGFPLQGNGRPGVSMIPPILGGGTWFNSELKDVKFDLDEANRILDEAGYLKGSDGVRTKGDIRLEMRLQYPSDQHNYPRTAEMIANWLAQIGIKATPQDPGSSFGFGSQPEQVRVQYTGYERIRCVQPGSTLDRLRVLAIIRAFRYGKDRQ